MGQLRLLLWKNYKLKVRVCASRHTLIASAQTRNCLGTCGACRRVESDCSDACGAARAGCEMLFPCAVFMLIILIRMLVKVDDVAFSAWRRAHAQLCSVGMRNAFWLPRA
jgi:hypothetical protein